MTKQLPYNSLAEKLPKPFYSAVSHFLKFSAWLTFSLFLLYYTVDRAYKAKKLKSYSRKTLFPP